MKDTVVGTNQYYNPESCAWILGEKCEWWIHVVTPQQELLLPPWPEPQEMFQTDWGCSVPLGPNPALQGVTGQDSYPLVTAQQGFPAQNTFHSWNRLNLGNWVSFLHHPLKRSCKECYKQEKDSSETPVRWTKYLAKSWYKEWNHVSWNVSWNDTMACLGQDLKDYLVANPCHEQGCTHHAKDAWEKAFQKILSTNEQSKLHPPLDSKVLHFSQQWRSTFPIHTLVQSASLTQNPAITYHTTKPEPQRNTDISIVSAIN